MMKMRISLIVAVLMLLAGPAAAGETADSGRSPSAEGATVGFANLADGDVLPPTFTLKFSISGMAISPAGVAIDYTGHFHLLVDLSELPPLDQPLPVDDHVLHFDQGQTSAELQLTEGPHTLQVLLADHAQLPHDPPVISDVISVTVSAHAPPLDEPGNR
jgi:hypothetical protein